MRFLMSGTLLSGLVISNAFKSENVYNIVLPRSQISYYKVDELVEDNVTLYSRITSFHYARMYLKCLPFYNTFIRKYGFEICKDREWTLFGYAELDQQDDNAQVLVDTAKITKYSKMHPTAI